MGTVQELKDAYEKGMLKSQVHELVMRNEMLVRENQLLMQKVRVLKGRLRRGSVEYRRS